MTYADVKAKKIAGQTVTVQELDAAIEHQTLVVAVASGSLAKHLAKLGVADKHPLPAPHGSGGPRRPPGRAPPPRVQPAGAAQRLEGAGGQRGRDGLVVSSLGQIGLRLFKGRSLCLYRRCRRRRNWSSFDPWTLQRIAVARSNTACPQNQNEDQRLLHILSRAQHSGLYGVPPYYT